MSVSRKYRRGAIYVFKERILQVREYPKITNLHFFFQQIERINDFITLESLKT